MKLSDITSRASAPAPWSEGDNIPWDNPDFSGRMLKEHLSQDHDLASRRAETIDMHVTWIHRNLLSQKPSRILDIACGPGLYTHRLAALGHECVGIDFGPASVAYAIERAREDDLVCTYFQKDVREAEFGSGFDLAMLIFGQLNVFRPAEAETILRKAHSALASNGILLLEPQRFESIRKRGESPRTWSSEEAGLFSDKPHIWLEEKSWDAQSKTTTERFYIVDAETASVTRYALTNQAYTDDSFRSLLMRCGFTGVEFFPSLGDTDTEDEHFIAIAAGKKDPSEQ